VTETQPGWHADPAGRAARRYWDGTRWTVHVADQQGRQWTDDAFAPSPPAPQQPSVVINNVMNAGPAVVVGPQKSVATAVLLTIFFGPLGMFYATVPGAFVMLFISVIAAAFTLGLSLLITWPICIIWAVSAVNTHNQTAVVLAGPVPVAYQVGPYPPQPAAPAPVAQNPSPPPPYQPPLSPPPPGQLPGSTGTLPGIPVPPPREESHERPSGDESDQTQPF
jgi:hypothetical protein